MSKVKFLLLLLIPLLQGCSWIVRFFIVNDTDKPVQLEITTNPYHGGFNIFYEREFYSYPGDNGKIYWEQQHEIRPDTLENYWHFNVSLPPHATLEIGRLHNDRYERHDQTFINDRFFNLEKLIVKRSGNSTEVTRSTFDEYFKKGKNGELFYYITQKR